MITEQTLYRFLYLEEVSYVTGYPHDILLRKESKDWLDLILDHCDIMRQSEHEIVCGNPHTQRIEFIYHIKHSHVYMNNKSLDENIHYILYCKFLLNDIQLDTILRAKIKSFLKRKNVVIERKIKFVYHIRFN